jgi:hypothetical protein
VAQPRKVKPVATDIRRLNVEDGYRSAASGGGQKFLASGGFCIVGGGWSGECSHGNVAVIGKLGGRIPVRLRENPKQSRFGFFARQSFTRTPCLYSLLSAPEMHIFRRSERPDTVKLCRRALPSCSSILPASWEIRPIRVTRLR